MKINLVHNFINQKNKMRQLMVIQNYWLTDENNYLINKVW